MTRKKTGRALLSSVLSLVLCCSMLIGTTFAWFTDSVTSTGNIIKSGTLDVEMSWSNTKDGTYKDASEGAIFNYKFWEPGYVDIKYIKLENVGDLAFKYQLHILPDDNTADAMMLAEVIDVYATVVGGEFTAPSRDTVENLTKLGSLKELMVSANGADDGVLLPAVGKGNTIDVELPAGTESYTGEVTVCLALKMQETAGNEYQDLSVGNGFNVRLNATQMTYENDSFDSEYDTNSPYTTPEVWLNGEKLDYQGGPLTVEGGTLKLKDVTIAADSGVSTFAAAAETNALTITGDTVLTVVGDVEIIGGKDGHGIFVEDGVKLTITGTGSLVAIGNNGKEYETSGNYTNDASATEYESTGGSGIGGKNAVIVIDGLKRLKAEGYGVHGFGIGGAGADVTISDTTVLSARGGFVNVTGEYNDAKYNKSEPNGGAAIGGKTITIEDSRIVKAIGGSKAAGIGAQYHNGADITITNSTIEKVVGGASSAGIGGSRVSNGAMEDGVTITITKSTINAQGGYFGAGIGSGYDTYTQTKQPMCTLNITDSKITAVGGKYAAGVGTGYHNAALTGEIKNSTVNADSGEKVYKDTYTTAQDIGFGVVNPDREGKQVGSKLIYNGTTIRLSFIEMKTAATTAELTDALKAEGKDVIELGADIPADSGKIMVSGVLLDGNGKKINVTVKGSTDAAISTTGGTIQNLEITHANHSTLGVGIGLSPYSSDKLSEDLVIDGVTVFQADSIFDRNIMYAIYAETANNPDVVISNSALYGAVDVPGAKTFTATNTTFGSGSYWFLAVSGEASFTNCTFESTYCILAYDTAAGKTITMNNCNVAGTPLTAENFKSLLVSTAWDYSSEMCSTNLEDCTIIIDGATVTW